MASGCLISTWQFFWVEFFGAEPHERLGKVSMKTVYPVLDSSKFIQQNKENGNFMKGINEMTLLLQSKNGELFDRFTELLK